MRKLVFAALAGAALLAACTPSATTGGTGAGAPSTPGTERSGANRRSNLITADEIREARVVNALQAVQSLRPQWLRTRGSTSPGGATVEVYRNETNVGMAQLRNIAANSIVEIRYYGSVEATQRWGMGHENGAIQVITR